jgi:acyl carrier protein
LNTLEQEIRAFLTDNFLLTQEAIELAGDESLTRRGIVDSVGLLEVILFLESNYGIDVPDDEVMPGNMDTIDNIVGYLARKFAAAAAADDGVSPADRAR